MTDTYSVLHIPGNICKRLGPVMQKPFPDEALPWGDDADARRRHCFSIISSAQLFAHSNNLDWIQ